MRNLLLAAILSVFSIVALAQVPIPVVATSVVLADLADKVGGEEVSVTPIIPAGFCPAHYDLKPSDLLAISRAKLVLYHGIEPWLETLLGNVNPEAKVLVLSGPWITPASMIEKARAISVALGELLPEKAGYFASRAEGFARDVQALGEELKVRAEELKLSQVPAIVMAWQADFAQWLGLNVVATYLPEERLSLKALAELSAQGREAGVLLVIDNLQSGVSFGARLAHELGAIHVVLTSFPGAIPGAVDLSAMLQANAEAVFSAVESLEG